MSITAVKDVATVLSLLLDDGDATKFPQGFVFDSGGSQVRAAQDLVHVSLGLYTKAFTFTTIDDFDVVYEIFNEVGHTTESVLHPRVQERWQVTLSLEAQVWDALVASHVATGSFGEAVRLMRALGQEHYMLDKTTYDSQGLMLSGRVRVFATATDLNNAAAGAADGADSEIFRFTVTSVGATPGRVDDYRFRRDL